MKKGLRITLRIGAVVIILLICTWIFLWGYITYNKAEIIEKVKVRINQQIKGKVEISDLSIDFFYSFPNISVRLSNICIRDSLWDQHHHDFLKAKKIYVRMQFFSLFSGNPSIEKVSVEKAQIYYYTDSTGYSNLVNANGPAEKNKTTSIPDLFFKETRFIYDYPAHNKFHDIEVNALECHEESGIAGHVLKININGLVHGLGFNTQKGSYLKEKNLKGAFDIRLTKTNAIQFDQVKIIIDKQPFVLAGNFQMDIAEPVFSLSIQAPEINFKKAIGLLTESTQQKFETYNILDPININAVLIGSMAYQSIPLANISFSVKDVGIETRAGRFNNCSFAANFTNQSDTSKPRIDANSMIAIKKFSGKWENILLTANTIEIVNLVAPFLNCDLHSSFDLVGLNDLSGSNSIQFIKGSGQMDINYKGSLVNGDTVATVMDGHISLKDAEINYLPRNIAFKNLRGKCIFKNKDLFIEQLQTSAGTTELAMSGSIRNLVGLIYKNPEQLILEWNISTPYLDLLDFMAFLGKKSDATSKSLQSKSKLIQTANKIDRMLEYGTANLNIQAGKIRYKKFTATNITTSLTLLQNAIILNSAKLNHAGGTILLNGSLTDEGRMNLVKLTSTISHVDIPSLFNAFNNFGQDAITGQNMKGQLSATVNLSTSLSDKALINEKSLKSTVNFSVVNGELNNFEPLQKIATTVFKKRDFSMVRFAELKDKLEINGTAINFDRMEIRSNVFTMFVAGVYDTKMGTDMSLQVPLRNLKKIADDVVIVNKGRVGLNIKIRAKTGDDGKLKISWDPFKKGEK